jgi:hypothetical protein
LYKAAVALNGSGVSLLERNRYHDAMLVFKDDALDLIRAACNDNVVKTLFHMGNKNAWILNKPEEAINHCLSKASNFLILSSQNVWCGCGATTNKLTVLTDDQSPALVVDLTQNLFDSMSIYAICIRENKLVDDVCSLEIEIAIILHNFFATAAYLHHVKTMELGDAILFYGPLQYFYLSLEVLS